MNNLNKYMGKAHKNCTIGTLFCLHHIRGTAFITRLNLYVYIVEDTETFQNIYIVLYRAFGFIDTFS